IELREQGLKIAREIGDRRGEARALVSLGLAYQALGDRPRAIESYQQTLTIVRETADRRGEAHALWNLSRALHEKGHRAVELQRAEASLEILEEIEHPLAPNVRHQLAEWNRTLDQR